VWWAARANILTWPSGVLNIFCFFLLFYQSQLYSDMLLQVFFMITTVYGWKSWSKSAVDKKFEIGSITRRKWLFYLSILLIGSFLWGLLISKIHLFLPDLFPKIAAFPYLDAFTAIASVIATFLLAKKKWESWMFWLIIDAVCVFVYFYKGLYLVSAAYIIFFGIAAYGLLNWYKKNHMGKRRANLQSFVNP